MHASTSAPASPDAELRRHRAQPLTDSAAYVRPAPRCPRYLCPGRPSCIHFSRGSDGTASFDESAVCYEMRGFLLGRCGVESDGRREPVPIVGRLAVSGKSFCRCGLLRHVMRTARFVCWLVMVIIRAAQRSMSCSAWTAGTSWPSGSQMRARRIQASARCAHSHRWLLLGTMLRTDEVLQLRVAAFWRRLQSPAERHLVRAFTCTH